LSIRCWDWQRNKLESPSTVFRGFTNIPLCIDVDPNSMQLIMGCKGCDGSSLYLWDTRNNSAPKAQFDEHEQDIVSCFFISAQTAISASKDNVILIWDLVSMDILCKYYLNMGSSCTSMSLCCRRFSVTSLKGEIMNFEISPTFQISVL